jgi:hypothetical protein
MPLAPGEPSGKVSSDAQQVRTPYIKPFHMNMMQRLLNSLVVDRYLCRSQSAAGAAAGLEPLPYRQLSMPVYSLSTHPAGTV